MFGQFGGQKCIEPIGDKKVCKPTSECKEAPPPVCSATEFQCESGNKSSLNVNLMLLLIVLQSYQVHINVQYLYENY